MEKVTIDPLGVIQFLKHFTGATDAVHVHVRDKMIYLYYGGSGLEAFLAVGEADIPDGVWTAKRSKLRRLSEDSNKVGKWLLFETTEGPQLTAYGTGEPLEFEFVDTGETHNPYAHNEILPVATISMDDVKTAVSISDRCELDGTRYGLARVLFDSGYAVATDGRRMAVAQVTDYTRMIPVDARLLEFASVTKETIDCYPNSRSDNFTCICGCLVIVHDDLRFPNWQAVMNFEEADTVVYTDARALLKQSKDCIAADKECTSEKYVLGEFKAKFNPYYMMAAMKGMKSVKIDFKEKFDEEGFLATPIHVASPERPDLREVIMPCAIH